MDRQQEVKKILWWILWANLAVAAAKIIYGYFGHSLSMRADGTHSLLDGSSNIIGLVGLALASKPADATHPYGHRKIEVVVSWMIGLFILGAMFEILRDVFSHQAHSSISVLGTGTGFAVALVTLFINIIVTYWERKKGKELKSGILLADAHHTFSDIFVTLGVIASLVAVHFGILWADKVIALGIAALIGSIALRIFIEGANVLLDRAQLNPKKIEAVAESVEGVLNCHRVRSRGVEGYVCIDCHILLSNQITLQQAHQITHRVEEKIKQTYPEVTDILIHTEPASDGREKHPWE